jgi:pyridinium-3,5-bisthiocarboxylic acid mononucleotide nickel chelatase
VQKVSSLMLGTPMKLAYLDCSSGASGDMLLGAMLDAGLPLEWLCGELEKIPLGDYEVEVRRVLRSGLAGTHLMFHIPAEQPDRHLHQIEELLAQSTLPESVKARALRVFTRLAEVEGKLHAKPPGEVHFHEVGAVDAILDIVGVCLGFEQLGIEELVSSPLNVGGGRVEATHGSLPVPAPATAELLRGVPIYSSGVEGEMVTPTGAAIVTTLASGFGCMPAMKAERIGYGAGTRDFPGHPNLLRLFLGERFAKAESRPPGPGEDVVTVIQANLDDMSPELYGYFVERALAQGALDVTSTAVQMKKNRPGVEITVLCHPDQAKAMAELLFAETTTIGMRTYEARRQVLERELVSVETPYGPARVKVARRCGKVLNVAPEYEDCRRLAEEKSVPLKQVMLAAQMAWKKESGDSA